MIDNRRFAVYSWVVVAYNLVVIMWGAFVRATGSGAGCGRHWPLCNGEVIPRSANTEMMIEFSHRISSGLALLSVVVLLIWAFRAYPKGYLVRRGAVVAMFFMVLEALVGAGLVLFEYVATNVSVARAWWMAGHLVNTFFLLAALALTAWWASGHRPLMLRGQGWFPLLLLPGLLGMLILGASGAVTALGDTLLLNANMRPEDSALLATLIDLRIYHPLLAMAVGLLLLATVLFAVSRRPSGQTRRLAWLLGGLFITQLLVGAFNVALKAPVPIQLIHLLLSNLIWISLVLLSNEALSQLPESTDKRAQLQQVPSSPQT